MSIIIMLQNDINIALDNFIMTITNLATTIKVVLYWYNNGNIVAIDTIIRSEDSKIMLIAEKKVCSSLVVVKSIH